MKLSTSYIAIGTNQGNRNVNIEAAISLLKQNSNIEVVQISQMLDNPPREGITSGNFLNGALEIKTTLSPQDLKKACKEIEKTLGRDINQKESKPLGRVIDLDILFYEDLIINEENLTIPHPRLHLRDFVMIPLLEIAKDFVHPVLKKPLKEIELSMCLS